MATVSSVTDEQTVEVVVSGPDDVTRMYIVSGIAQAGLSASTGSSTYGSASGTFEAHVGPALTTGQFRRAVATASLSGVSGYGDEVMQAWNVLGVDADYDDDVGRVQLQFDLHTSVQSTATGYTSTGIYGVGFQVVILAAV